MHAHQWARSFAVTDDDIDFIMSALLETETPLDTDAIVRILIQNRLAREAAALQEKFKDVVPYNPAHSYAIGQKLVFPALAYAVGKVVEERPGNNPAYGSYSVITVEFEDGSEPQFRQFAANYADHILSKASSNGGETPYNAVTLSVDEILEAERARIVKLVEDQLRSHEDLVSVAGLWFPRSLMLDIHEGHLNLAEAALDLADGGPLSTEQIIEAIGGLGRSPLALQVFSLNYALKSDDRFDEVGPINKVLWYLKRLEPPEVRSVPAMLKYQPIEYDQALLTPEMIALEQEIGDEWSPIAEPEQFPGEASISLIYPHRRLGTLPLTARMRSIFPTARRTSRIWVTLIDGQDGAEYPGWVVWQDRYVFGLSQLYRKHKLPVGATITVRTSEEPGKIVVDFHAHRPRTEYVRLIVPKNGQITFDEEKRAIGAEYDDLMILGADDLKAVDALFEATQQSRRGLVSILTTLMTELGKMSPQKTVHAKTLYSAVNVLRRCPPGPIFAALASSPEFEHVGNNYWRLIPD